MEQKNNKYYSYISEYYAANPTKFEKRKNNLKPVLYLGLAVVGAVLAIFPGLLPLAGWLVRTAGIIKMCIRDSSTRYLAKDEARVLADPSRYYKGGKPDLKLYDAKFASLNPDDKIEMAKAVAEEALGKDERIISVGSSYGDGEDFAYRLISNCLLYTSRCV